MKPIFYYSIIIALAALFVSCEKDYEAEASPVDGAAGIGDTRWIRTFAAGEKTYYVFFSSARLEEGVNVLQATVYLENMKSITAYRIEIDPRMPDMENHSSPNNKPLEWNAEKNAYQGTLNLTMTGWWRLNLKVYDDKGDLVGGSDVIGKDS
ncbi:MAG: FixH family protein, partial [Tannerellaceae bacterium]|nr:FixH family protein [Tannerellaceae bacterium]